MKLLCFLITVMLFPFVLYGQELKIPPEVKSAFEKLYPKASEIKWAKDKQSDYKVGFEDDGKYTAAVFNKKGGLKETKSLFSFAELPKSIAPAIAMKHAGYYISVAYKIIDGKGKASFEVEIKKGKVRKVLRFDQDGRQLAR